MSDGSLATQTEDWIVDQIRAIQWNGNPLFNSEDVGPWEGPDTDSPEAITGEFISMNRDLVAKVFFIDDTVVDLANGQQDLKPRYLIIVGRRNQRPGESRRGTTTSPGTNVIRDLLRYALHDKRPTDTGALLNDGTYCTDRVTWVASQIVVATRGMTIQQHTLTADEVPIAGA